MYRLTPTETDLGTAEGASTITPLSFSTTTNSPDDSELLSQSTYPLSSVRKLNSTQNLKGPLLSLKVVWIQNQKGAESYALPE